MIRSPALRTITVAAALAAAALGTFFAAPLAAQTLVAADPVVGQVSLLIGEARLVRRDGSALQLRQGGSIAVGDRIETTANGHVHVRFVDNAVVSVRPESVLEVQSYRFDATNPQANEVRLKVAQGVTRSISGAATDADKSRFRLNTPIAAIGVRGTDFIVQAGANDARATVASGAIVMSPIGNGCSADGLGPCSGRAAQLLSADMGRMMVELRSGERMPRVVPAADHLLASSTPSTESRAAARAAALAAAQPQLTEARAINNDHTAALLLKVVPLSSLDSVALGSAPDKSAQLAWGRYMQDLPEGKGGIVMNFNDAFRGGARQVTVGDTQVGLFRSGSDAAAEAALNSQTATRVDFRLTRAEATYSLGARSEAAEMNGGTFSVDFLNRRFATALLMSSASAGSAELRAAGDIRSNGHFVLQEPGQYVGGALSVDGKEAGFFFWRDFGGGQFKGRTLWGR